MSPFEEILTASGETLLKHLYKGAKRAQGSSQHERMAEIGATLGLNEVQLTCALGFNPIVREMPDLVEMLGYPSLDSLTRERSDYFGSDIYRKLTIKNVLLIYANVISDSEALDVMQYLLPARLINIEGRIEATVNSIVIERYKKEMRAIYNDGVGQIDFAETRLERTHSGFRSLLDEVTMIVESRLIPVGDIFFRENILPEEKRRLMIRGLIPQEIVEQRLEDETISPREREVLEEQIAIMVANKV